MNHLEPRAELTAFSQVWLPAPHILNQLPTLTSLEIFPGVGGYSSGEAEKERQPQQK